MAEFVIWMDSDIFVRLGFVVLVFAMALVVWRVVDPAPKPVGRFVFGIVWLLCSAVQFLAPFVFLALSEKSVDTAAAVWVGQSVIMLLVLAYFARRRCADMGVTLWMAALAGVPFAGLWLVFAAPTDKARWTDRTARARALRVGVLFTLAVGVVLGAAFLAQVLRNQHTTTIPNTMELPLERAIAVQAAVMQGSAPLVIDASTVLISAQADGALLIINYELRGDLAAGDPQAFEARMAATLPARVCAAPVLAQILIDGGTIQFNYAAADTGDRRVTLSGGCG